MPIKPYELARRLVAHDGAISASLVPYKWLIGGSMEITAELRPLRDELAKVFGRKRKADKTLEAITKQLFSGKPDKAQNPKPGKKRRVETSHACFEEEELGHVDAGRAESEEAASGSDSSDPAADRDSGVARGVATGVIGVDEDAELALDVEDENDWGAAHRDNLLPTWSPDGFQVRQRGTERILGRIKPLRVGTAQEAVSVYCRLHQCAPPLKRLCQALPQRKALAWLLEGLEMPDGKSGQAEHMALWREYSCRAVG